MIDSVLRNLREYVDQQRQAAEGWLKTGNKFGKDRFEYLTAHCSGVMKAVVEIENCTPPAGLYGKYRIAKADMSPTDPAAQYFVLRIDTDQAARMALLTYAQYVEADNPTLADDLRQWLDVTGPINRGEIEC